MALHRDIYWVGKQWAVTGYGIQACDQKQKGKFDIEAARIWEDGVLDSLRDQKWLNAKDFDKAISVARTHYPEPPRKAAPPPAPATTKSPDKSPDKTPEKIDPPEKKRAPRLKAEGAAAEPANPVAPAFEMRVNGWPAKLVPVWRVRIRR
jgi:hypothetical protein